MKKFLLSLFMIVFAQSCYAQIGYVDYSVIYKNLPVAQQYQKKINDKAAEVRNYNLETQKLIKAQTSLDDKNKIKDSRKENLYKLEKEYITLRSKIDEIVKQKVAVASNNVMTQKGLDAIIDSRMRISGGVDCTQEVLKAIK